MGRLHHVMRNVGNTHAVQGRLSDRRHGVERDPAVDADVEVLTVLAEIPDEEATMGGQAEIDAGVFGEITRCHRLWPAFEVGRRRHYRPDEVGADRHGDHVLVDLLPQPHASVVAVRRRCRSGCSR